MSTQYKLTYLGLLPTKKHSTTIFYTGKEYLQLYWYKEKADEDTEGEREQKKGAQPI